MSQRQPAPNSLRHRPRGVAEWDRGLALRAVALGWAWTLFGSRKISKLEYSQCRVFPFRGHCTRAYFASGKMFEGQKRSSAYHPGARAGRFVGQPCFARLVHLQGRYSFVPEKYRQQD